jgi:hypothetical protein
MFSGQTGRELMRHLAWLDLDAVAEAALAAEAEAIGVAAGEAGAAGGEVRAARTGALVGWCSPAVRRRENGDVGVPPAPVLAPVAAAHAERVVAAVGAAIADALRGA